MKNSTKLLATLVPVTTVAAVAPAVSDVEAAGDYKVMEIVYDHEDGGIINYTDLSEAMLDGEGDIYDFAQNNGIKAIGIGEGTYVRYEDYALGVLDGKPIDEVMTELAENPIPAEEVNAFEEVTFGEVPEVIDIY